MAIPDLILNTDKSSVDINNDRITIRQSERGLVLTATIKAKDGTNYDLSGKTVQFAENKAGTKLVLDENVQIDSSKPGVIHYTLDKNVYSISGTAWFEIITGQSTVVDTTQNFYIDVLRDAEINVANDNYISSLNGLIAHVKVAGDKAQETINTLVTQLTQDVKSKQQDADNVTANLTKKFDTQINQLKADLSDYQSKYNKLASDWATELKTISDKADSDINGKYKQKLIDLQNDYNSWKTKTVADFNATVDPIKKSIEKNTSDVDSVTKSVQSTIAQMNNLKQSFDRIDFTKFVTGDQIKNYYTKTDVNNLMSDLRAKIATAGTVKTVDNIQPDSHGNIQTDHYTKSQTDQKLGQKITFVKCDSPQAAHDASTRPAADGSIVLGIYDMNDEPSQAVVGDQKINIEWLYNHLNDLSTQVSGLSSLQSLIAGKANSADVYTKNDTDSIVNTLKGLIAGKANSADVYTKSGTDSIVNTLKGLIANAGKLKTITINGGAKVAPDTSGNANLTISQPNMSAYATKADLDAATHGIPISEADYNKLPAEQKNKASVIYIVH